MYLKRKIDKDLLLWKEEKERKPLLLRGARQIGKSSSVRSLSSEFKYYLEINFEEHISAHQVFEQDLTPQRICEELSLLFNVPIIEGETLLFFDEIQACPKAISSLRFFYEKMPKQHLIAAGSLLEFALLDLPSFGVGRVRSIFMHPFSFDEFLMAMEQDNLLKAIQKGVEQHSLSDAVHQRIVGLFKKFLLIGGMPEAVKKYLASNDLNECQKVLDDLVISIRADFAKYKTRVPAVNISTVLDSVIEQNGKKFIFSKVADTCSHKQAKEAIELLVMANVVIPIMHTSANGLPLGAEVNLKKQKFMFFDTGLTQRLLKLNLVDLVFSDDFDSINKGSLAEQFVGLELIKGVSPYQQESLFYWHREAKSSNAEVDYIIQQGDKIRALEVKSGIKGKMHSLRLFISEKQSDFGYRVSLENFSEYENIKVLPLYAASRLANR